MAVPQNVKQNPPKLLSPSRPTTLISTKPDTACPKLPRSGEDWGLSNLPGLHVALPGRAGTAVHRPAWVDGRRAIRIRTWACSPMIFSSPSSPPAALKTMQLTKPRRCPEGVLSDAT